MSIAERAGAAHELLSRYSHPNISELRAADIARTAGRLAALLGVDPASVRPTPEFNWPLRSAAPLILLVDDPDEPGRVYTFSYRDPLYDDEPFHLLGPCPICGGTVALAEIVRLADLGAFLAHGLAPIAENRPLPDSYPDAFEAHAGHLTTCPFRQGEI